MAWVKGQSGNPGGMPKGTAEIAQMARERSPDVMARLIKIATTSKNERAAIAAAGVLLERGFGKPIQPIDTGASVLDLLTPEERADLAVTLEDIVARERGDPREPEVRH